MKQQHPTTRPSVLKYLDVLLGVLVFFGGTYLGVRHLDALAPEGSAIKSHERLYGSAVMLATGRGFYEPDPDACPALRAFLFREVDTLSPDVLPAHIPAGFQQTAAYHRYLVYTVAFFWWMLGISWSNVEPMMALMLGWCAVAIYGLMRLGMGRLLSFLLTAIVVCSPAMLLIMTDMRDFSKAPFILSIIFFLGYALKNNLSLRRLLGVAVCLGALNGIGIGFRQDLLVFIPPIVIALAVAAWRQERASLVSRSAVVAVYLFFYLVTAWPMLGRMESSVQLYHPLVQGFSMKRMDALGLEPASYEMLASGGDNYVFAMLYDYYRRVNQEPDAHFTMDSPGAEAAGRQWLIDAGLHFPADLLARGYGGALRTLRYADGFPPPFLVMPAPWQQRVAAAHQAFAHHLNRFGLVYACAAILIIGGHSPLAALGLLVFALYMCGYIGLQCEFRHTFHLAFAPFWALGFLVENALHGAGGLLRRSGSSPLLFDPERRNRFGKRMLLSALCAVLVTVTPLYALRLYQQVRVGGLLRSYDQLDLLPTPTQRDSRYGWTLYSLEDDRPDPDREAGDLESLYASIYAIATFIRNPIWHTRARLMVVELAADGEQPVWMLVKHESQVDGNNFSQMMRLSWPVSDGGSVFYYFPVYELLHHNAFENGAAARNRFTGIGLPEAQTSAFKGLYEVQDLSPLHFLLHLVRQAPPASRSLYKGLIFCPDPLDQYRVDTDISGLYSITGTAAFNHGRYQEASLFSRAALLFADDKPKGLAPSERMTILNLLRGVGELDMARELILNMAEVYDESKEILAHLLADIGLEYMAQNKTVLADAAVAEAVALVPDKGPEVLLRVAETLSSHGDADAAFARYRKLMLAYPEYEEGMLRLVAFLDSHDRNDAYKPLIEAVVAAHPKAIMPHLWLAGAYEASGDFAAATHHIAAAHANDPDHVEAALRFVAATITPDDYGSTQQHITALLDKQPHFRATAARILALSGDRFTEAGAYAEAVVMYRLAGEIAPEDASLHHKLINVVEADGQYATALSLLPVLIRTEQGERAASLLDRLSGETGGRQEHADLWQRLHEEYPDNSIVQRYYGKALYEAGDFVGAANLFDRLSDAEPLTRDMVIRRWIARVASGKVRPEDGSAFPEDGLEDISLTAGLIGQALAADAYSDRADLLVRAAVLLDPRTNPPGVLVEILGNHLEGRHDFEHALNLYRTALSMGRVTADLAARLDAVHARWGTPAARLSDFRFLALHHQDDPVITRHFIAALLEAGQVGEAAEVYAAIGEKDAALAPMALHLATVLPEFNEMDKTQEILEEAVRLDSTLAASAADAAAAAGDGLRRQGSPEGAASFYRMAVGFAPDHDFAWLKLGETLAELHEADEAVAAWRRTVQVLPDGPAAREAARRLDILLSWEQRLEFWASLADLLPDAVDPASRYILALLDADRIDQALAQSELLAQRHSEHGDVQVLLAAALCRAGDVDAGLMVLEGLRPNDTPVFFEAAGRIAEAGVVLLEKDEWAQAERLVRAAIALTPGNLLFHVYLGRIHLARNQCEDAIQVFRHVLTTMPESPRTAGLMDEAYACLASPERRVQEWRALVELHPDAAVPRNHLEQAERLIPMR